MTSSSNQLPLTPVPLDDLKSFLAINLIDGADDKHQDEAGATLTSSKKKRNQIDYHHDIIGWIHQSDVEAQALMDERDEIGAANLFGNDDNDDSDDGDDNDDDCEDDMSRNSDASDADYLGFVSRVRVWTSSTTDIDGYGGALSSKTGRIVYSKRQQWQDGIGSEVGKEDDAASNQNLTSIYVLSEAWEGWGFLLWASARYLANSFACPVKCRELLYGDDDAHRHRALRHHPLHNLSVLELGAGCGLPSLIAMQCQASAVVCTDLDLPNRIRCIAESLYRTTKYLTQNEEGSSPPSPARAVPYKWGTPTRQVLSTLEYMLSWPSIADIVDDEDKNDDQSTQPSKRFDVICSTDCLFMPHLHYELLTSIDALLKTGRQDEEESLSDNPGVCVLAFAIHAAYSKSDEVWSFVEKAKNFQCRYNHPFIVDVLKSTQLTPPKKGMEPEQGLVHVIRLTRSGLVQS